MEVFCGIDWAENHHDIAAVDETGRVLFKRRVTDDLAGFTAVSQLLAEHTDDSEFTVVDIAIETDRGLLVAALRAAGHRIFAVNPRSVSRYRDRHSTSGAKSDPADALVLADLLRTDRHAHRPMADNTDLVEAVRVLARAHQDAIWHRQEVANKLRSTLREFFPAALQAFPDLTTRTALAVLAAAPNPEAASKLTRAKLTSLLRAAGRGTRPADATRLAELFRADQLRQPGPVEQAMGITVATQVRVLTSATDAVRELEKALAPHFEKHPDAEIIDSLPGLGLVLGARVLGEFGDDRSRWPDAASRRRYAGTAPVTKQSGMGRIVLARHVRNRRLNNAIYLWAFSALTRDPHARAFYDHRRAVGDTHAKALRRLGNKLVGQLHHCLETGEPYNAEAAWNHPQHAAA